MAGPTGRPVPDATLWLLSAAGDTLATAMSEPRYGTIQLVRPARFACHDVEGEAPFSPEARDSWTRCFRRQSRWLAGTVPRIGAVAVAAGSCRARLPAVLSGSSDWWLWWVPLPHVGGRPYTNYTLSLALADSACGAAGRG